MLKVYNISKLSKCYIFTSENISCENCVFQRIVLILFIQLFNIEFVLSQSIYLYVIQKNINNLKIWFFCIFKSFKNQHFTQFIIKFKNGSEHAW